MKKHQNNPQTPIAVPRPHLPKFLDPPQVSILNEPLPIITVFVKKELHTRTNISTATSNGYSPVMRVWD